MSLSVKPGYVNPLSMMGEKKNGLTANNPLTQKDEKARNVQNLQLKKQALQNQIVLFKGTSNGVSENPETEEALEKQLEEIASLLKTAKSQEVFSTEGKKDMELSAPAKENFDVYAKEAEKTDSFGLYQLLQNEEKNGYTISFSPYRE